MGLIMPQAVRPKGKAYKIAVAILGIPENKQNKKSERDKRVDQRLLYSETARVR